VRTRDEQRRGADMPLDEVGCCHPRHSTRTRRASVPRYLPSLAIATAGVTEPAIVYGNQHGVVKLFAPSGGRCRIAPGDRNSPSAPDLLTVQLPLDD
jgi:hypothetical protein